MKVMIANRYGTCFSIAQSEKGKAEFKRNFEFSKNSTKEVISIFEAEPI